MISVFLTHFVVMAEAGFAGGGLGRIEQGREDPTCQSPTWRAHGDHKDVARGVMWDRDGGKSAHRLRRGSPRSLLSTGRGPQG